jgi:hypothetical protein
VLAASGAGLGLIAYSVFVGRLTGDWLAWAHIQRAWGRSFVGLSPIARGIGWVDRDGLLRVFSNIPIDTLNALAVIFAASLLWPVWRRLGSGWAVFVLLNAGLPFIAGGVLSLGRMTSTLFPIFLALAAVLPRRAVMPLVVAFAIAQGLIAVLFYTWRPMF